MSWSHIGYGLLGGVMVCVMAGESAYAQSQSATPSESGVSQTKKAKARPVKKPSKELQSLLAQAAKRRALAEQKTQPIHALKEQPAQPDVATQPTGITQPVVSDAPELVLQPAAEIAAQEKPLVVTQESPVVDSVDKPQVDEGMLLQGVTSIEDRAPHKRRKAARIADMKYDYLIGVAAMDSRKPNQALQFGKFNGLTDNKVYVLAAVDVQSRNGRRYWNFKADNIALENRSVHLDGGTRGKYKLHLAYSELGSLLSNTSQTPFDGAGGDTLTLPASFTRSPNTTGMTDLAASMKSVDLGTQRKEGDAGFSIAWGNNLGGTLAFRRYLKNGTKSLGAVVLPDAYGSQGLVLPEPVNYLTDEFRTGADWHGERGQANVEYYYSRFSNDNASLTWANPYANATSLTPYPDAGRTSLPPDNQHQRLSLSGSYRLATTTRLSVLYERGIMTQNEVFLPYTSNPASSVPIPLPRGSPDARINTTLLKFDLATQPLSALSLHAGYRRYKTENKTPRDLYLMVINDSGDQVIPADHMAQYNTPLDSDQQQLKLDGAYYFGQGTTLKLGYDHDQKKYHYRAVNRTRENTYSARLNKRWDAGATAFMDVAQGYRRADDYDHLRTFESGHTSDYWNPQLPAEHFDNLPAMRQFDIANRDRDRQGLGVMLLPREDLTLGLNADHNNDKYRASQFGLQQREATSVTMDTTLTPDEMSSWSLYYTRQIASWRQAGRAYDLGGVRVPQSSDPVNDWSAKHRDVIDTVGVNITLSFLDDSLPVRFAYTYSNIVTDISFTANPASIVNTSPVDMPTLRGKRHTLDLSGNYAVRDNLNVRGGLMVEFYRSSDWATDGIPPGSSVAPEMLTLSGSATPYRAMLVTTALNYHF